MLSDENGSRRRLKIHCYTNHTGHACHLNVPLSDKVYALLLLQAQAKELAEAVARQRNARQQRLHCAPGDHPDEFLSARREDEVAGSHARALQLDPPIARKGAAAGRG